MIKVYDLKDLKDANIKGYLKAINFFIKEVGAASYEAAERYAKMGGYMATVEGVIYKRYT